MATKLPDIPQETILGLLTSIDAGFVKLSCEVEPQDVHAGHIAYACSGGGFDAWQLVVHNDCNAWDYLSEVHSPDGKQVGYFELRQMPQVLSYSPSQNMAWLRYGIPGYLRFREEMWSGFTGERSETMETRLSRISRQKQLLDPRLVNLVEALQAVPAEEDPVYNTEVRKALQAWHQVAGPMFASSLDFVE